jgi:hypothetical protein
VERWSGHESSAKTKSIQLKLDFVHFWKGKMNDFVLGVTWGWLPKGVDWPKEKQRVPVLQAFAMRPTEADVGKGCSRPIAKGIEPLRIALRSQFEAFQARTSSLHLFKKCTKLLLSSLG